MMSMNHVYRICELVYVICVTKDKEFFLIKEESANIFIRKQCKCCLPLLMFRGKGDIRKV